MADPEPSKPRSSDPDAHSRALVRDQARGVAAREFVDILTCPGSVETVRFEVRWGRDVTALGRPGTGGRQPSINRSFEIEATRETREWLGEPRDHTHRGSLLQVWEIPDGEDGLIAARLSGQDVKNHETVFGQIHGLLEICKRAKPKPKYLIASMRNSGFRDYEARLDVAFIRDRVHAGDCSWVGYFKVDRIARDLLPAQLFYRFLRDTGTGMYLEELGRQVDWSNESDILLLNTLGTIGQFEGTRIKKRTHEPLVRRWLNTGRGWPSAKRMGFKRDAGDWLVVDPLQWPHLKFAHMEYAGSGDGGATSIRTRARRSPTGSTTSPQTGAGSTSGSITTPRSSRSTRSAAGGSISATSATPTPSACRSPLTAAAQTATACGCGRSSYKPSLNRPAYRSRSATYRPAPASATASSTGCSPTSR